MTRLVFVHGRAQQGKDPVELLRQWVDALTEGLGATNVPPAVVAATMPYYGDVLADWVGRESPRLVTYGAPADADEAPDAAPRDPELSTLAAELIRDLEVELGLTYDDVTAELPDGEAVTRGPVNWAWVQATLAALDRRVPAAGRGFLRFVADVEAYLRAPYVGPDIRQIVAEPLTQAVAEREPVVVVAHSLGSVPAYELLRELGTTIEVPLFVTVGSALGFATIQRHLRPPALARPAGIAHWLNVYDPRDPVTLRPPGRAVGFPGVDRHLRVANPHRDPHGIVGYLGHPEVALLIGRHLGPAA
ncbi:hypothetical protein [Embleya sp. NPDC059259]|uniref:hypothetical protein n=1 Tax=unclassified Embleya TaxID=2699296 RepID=UPI0036B344E8